MSTWETAVYKTLSGNGSKEDFVHTITGWLHTSITEYTEGSYEAISRRVTWLFPDGWAFVAATSCPLTLTHMTEEITSDTPAPVRGEEWNFAVHANGWQLATSGEDTSASEILQRMESFSAEHGEPTLLLPWEYMWVEAIAEESLEDYLEYKPEDEAELYTAMHALASAVMDGQVADLSPWAIEVTDPEDNMPAFCDWSRFQRVIAAISERKLMILNLDEHCAACSSGVYENAVKEDPELEGKRVFLTWGQNSQYMWLGDGRIFLDVYFSEEEDERAVKDLAVAEGIYELDPDEEWEPSGSWYFES